MFSEPSSLLLHRYGYPETNNSSQQLTILLQPTAAKVADVFGRVELILLSIVFYTVGTIVEACATTLEAFAAGAVIYQVRYTLMKSWPVSNIV